MSRDPSLDTFIAEAQELLGNMETVLLRCEQGGSDPEAVNELFRAAHTIKGSSGLFGLDAIVAFTHVVESTMDRIRCDGTGIDAGLAAALLECADHIGTLVGAADANLAETPELLQAGAAVLERLTAQAGFAPPEAHAGTAPAGGSPATAADGAADPAAAPPTSDAPAADGLRVRADSWHISVRFNAEVLRNGMDPLSFVRYLTTFGAITGIKVVTDRLPEVAEFDPEVCYLGFEMGLRTDANKTRIEAAFEFVKDDCTLRILPPRSLVADYVALIRDLDGAEGNIGGILVHCGTLTAAELAECLQAQNDQAGRDGGVAPRLGDLLVSAKMVQPSVVAAAAQQQTEARATRDAKSAEGRSIRVDGDKLDRLIDLIGELIIAGAATGSQARQAGLARLTESALHLARIVEEVRDQALKLRIVQIGATFTRFQRVVRDVARESGKEIHLEVAGAETELDKTLVERIADPLTHLVRNAIDHGIEKPEIRRARGKPDAGTVRLNAYHDAGSVIVEVADDGGGLNRDRILEKATQRGLVPEGAVLTDREIYELIFEPGFSTAEQVTNLSGRGVGMDVVKSNVTALRGSVEIDSQPGLGTQVRLRLPLTLAIIDGFQVGVGNSSFVIPLDLVEECVEMTADSEAGASRGHIVLHGAVLPLIRLRDMFDIGGAPKRRESVVVVRGGGKRAGVVVDDLMGELQAVIKPLSRLFRQLQGVAGSTILGTGRVALILDVPGLVERSQAASRRLHGAYVPVRPAADPVSIQ
jgi:two-component system chemotaxis sensor kinase CheA